MQQIIILKNIVGDGITNNYKIGKLNQLPNIDNIKCYWGYCKMNMYHSFVVEKPQ